MLRSIRKKKKGRKTAKYVIQQWKAPLGGVYKIYWNTAIDKSRKMMGVGVIVKDYECKVLAVMGTSRMHIIDLTMAEGYSAWKAVLFGRDFGSTEYHSGMRCCGDSITFSQGIPFMAEVW